MATFVDKQPIPVHIDNVGKFKLYQRNYLTKIRHYISVKLNQLMNNMSLYIGNEDIVVNF